MFLTKLSEWTWGGLGPGILSGFHIAWVLICVVLCIVFVRFAKKNKDPKTIDRVILILGIILLISEIIRQGIYHFEYYKYFRIDVLPYAFCSAPMYFAFIGSLTKKEKIKDVSYKFISFYGIIGGIGAMAYPVGLETELIYMSFQTMIWHSILVVMGVYLIAAKDYGINFKKEILTASVVFVACTVLAIGLNELTYHAYLEPIQKPNITKDYNPGAYQYYKFGTYDEETEESAFLLFENEKLSVTEDCKKASNVVIVYHQDLSGQLALLIEDSEGNEKYITITENRELLLTDNIETIFTFAYYEDITIFVTKINDVNYFITNNLEVSSDEQYENHLDFIDLHIEHDGDYANFFFVSNHAETNIPGLNYIQKAVPYPVFVCVYLAAVFMASSIVFYAVYGIRLIYSKRRVSSSNNEL